MYAVLDGADRVREKIIIRNAQGTFGQKQIARNDYLQVDLDDTEASKYSEIDLKQLQRLLSRNFFDF